MTDEAPPKKKQPTHSLKLMDPETCRHGEIGYAYLDERTGVVSIYLNPGVSIGYEETIHMTLRLFPRDR